MVLAPHPILPNRFLNACQSSDAHPAPPGPGQTQGYRGFPRDIVALSLKPVHAGARRHPLDNAHSRRQAARKRRSVLRCPVAPPPTQISFSTSPPQGLEPLMVKFETHGNRDVCVCLQKLEQPASRFLNQILADQGSRNIFAVGSSVNLLESGPV